MSNDVYCIFGCREDREGSGVVDEEMHFWTFALACFSFLTKGLIFEMIKKILGMLMGTNAVKMIESASGGVEVAGMMTKLGISTEQGSSIVLMLISFMKGKVGDEVVDQMCDQIPAVKSFLDSSKKDE